MQLPMRRVFGISLAYLVTCAYAIAQTPEERTTQSIGVTAENTETPTDGSRILPAPLLMNAGRPPMALSGPCSRARVLSP